MSAAGVGPADRAAIEELNARFAWALDLQEFEKLRRVFTPDARYTSGTAVREGVGAIVAGFTTRTGIRTTRLGWSSLTLEAAGDEVHGRSSWYAFAANQAAPVAGTGTYMVADFIDVYVSIPDVGWRIAARTIRPVFRDAELAPA